MHILVDPVIVLVLAVFAALVVWECWSSRILGKRVRHTGGGEVPQQPTAPGPAVKRPVGRPSSA